MVKQSEQAAEGAKHETINPIAGGGMSDALLKYWPIATAFVGFLIWLIRLEARSIENTKEIKRLWSQRREDMDLARQSREDTNAMLAEIRDDIKSIIRGART